jgi:tetratricopeptide (TPR) repeat protein
MAAFCFVVAIACLVRRSRPITLPIICFVVVLVVLYSGSLDRLGGALAISAIGVGVVLLAIAILYLSVRWRDRVWLEAVRLSREGDIEGAVALLQEHLRQAGPSATAYNYLAIMLIVQQRYDEALRMAEKAEQAGGPQPHILGSKGVALWKVGRAQEGLAYLQEAARQQPDNLLAACNLGLLLAELGQGEEAAEVLKRAEQLYATQFILIGAAERRLRKESLEELRRRVSEVWPEP